MGPWITLMAPALWAERRIAARGRWVTGQAWHPLGLVQSCAGGIGSAPASHLGIAG
jgi:hypothetical protein